MGPPMAAGRGSGPTRGRTCQGFDRGSMSQPTPPAPPTALDPSDPLAQLNDGFHAAYAARREAVLTGLGPAIAQLDDSMYLRIDGRRMVGPARTRRYHELKTMCHLPLAIQAILDELEDLDDLPAALTLPARGQLLELRRRAAAVAGSLAGRALEPAQDERQRRILAASLAFIAAVSTAGQVAREELDGFLRGTMLDIRANLEDAARDQLQTMHATLGGWVQDMSAGQWSRLVVVVGAAHMARTGNLAAQYFSLALGDRWEGRFEQEDGYAGRRVLTVENVRDEQEAFALLAMHRFDRRAANVFFGEEGRLGRDVLADAAERQLAAMFGTRPQRGEQAR